jgi:hypothetical protein
MKIKYHYNNKNVLNVNSTCMPRIGDKITIDIYKFVVLDAGLIHSLKHGSEDHIKVVLHKIGKVKRKNDISV